MMDVLAKSFEVDERTFWSDSSLLQLIPLLVPQLTFSVSLSHAFKGPDPSTSASAASYDKSLAALAGSTTSESVLKALNNAICLQTRDDDSRMRLAALRALGMIWESQGEEMTGFVGETVGEFISELLEDENGEVQREARATLKTIEKIAGGTAEYLD